MEIFAETDRWYMRKILDQDVEDYFAMDSHAEVHRYLGGNPITTIDQAADAIKNIKAQYEKYGIGRWAVVDKKSNKFIGWSGLKYEQSPFNKNERYYDIGYRLHPDCWGAGIAQETARASLSYAFDQLKIKIVSGTAHRDNLASNHILQKIGLKYIKSFEYYNLPCHWYSLRYTRLDSK